jgi:peptidoglycan/xylan/chitin deacetylase (PgdA/CDA1 family)
MNIIDILQENGEIWDLFTRKEEYNPIIKDEYERFCYYTSIERDVFEPRASNFLIERGLNIEYPNKAPFAVCLTHDIDTIYKENWRKRLDTFRSLQSLNISQSLQNILQFRSRKLPFYNFREIADLEERYGASSTFYFLALDKKDVDFNYDVADLTNEFDYLFKKRAEIGLQGGHNAFNSLNTLTEEKKRLERTLGKPVIGYRSHFLRFNVPDTWEFLRKAGFQHDSTIGYPDCIGFRNGMCHPYMPYNRNTNRVIDIIELPLVIRDTTLFDYMRLDWDEAWDITRNLINKTEKKCGVITFLWHNTTFVSDIHVKFYKKILEFCKTKNAWMTNAEEITAFWRDNVQI